MSTATATRLPAAAAKSGQIVMIPWEQIEPDPDQPREYFKASALAALKGSIGSSSQKLAATVRLVTADAPVQYRLVDGERRWRSAKDLGISVECIIRTDLEDPHVRRRFQVLANWNRQGHSVPETVRFLSAMLEDPEIEALERKDDKYFALGELFGHTPAWVRQHLGLKRLHHSLFERLGPETPKSQRFPVSVAFRLSAVSHKVQLEWAEKIDTAKLNASRAKRLMANELLETGQAATGHRGRRPSDNIELFRTFLKHLRLNGEGLQEMDERTFVRMIASRPVSERRAVKKQVAEAIEMLHDIKKRVEAVADNQVAGK